METHDLISIIIPVYNVEKYLPECLESILKQTYRNLEIILINDGSTDRSGIICNEYSEKDNRIVVKHIENSGVARARNIGLDLAKGKYIGFVDSDDYINEIMYESLYKNLIKENADIAICSAYSVYDKKIVHKKYEDIYLVMNSSETFTYMLKDGYFGIGIWDKFFKAEILKKYEFPNGKTNGEELELLYKVICDSNVIVYSSTPLYYYRQRNNSAIHQRKLNNGLPDSMKKMHNYVSKIHKNLYQLTLNHYILSCFQVYNKGIEYGIKDEFFYFYLNELKKYKKDLDFTFFSKSKSIQIRMFYKSRHIYNIIFKLLK
ncbi:glycosyltransferase, partial [Turicibacter sanguinis]|nr:glycosyltransferase [Turicibacter sanguinis]